MLLNKIKLAGFKSFVDPTTLQLNSQLVGIVGPNGCGKSNIIDAVRWVMGESSAKTLRGESMADVIFNGSATRQPVGQASIELVFDNSDGTIKGEYASYVEIAVRREVTRDGQSNYYLNNSKCRKRDIVDVFLGTGLGPRSYSIIEQGMISRIIEAKPEDLRGFFEEAAGISLYKKRRHETSIRMRHTRDNLTRIADICREQDLQLEKLEKQADSARRYQEQQIAKKQVETELLLLRWRDYDANIQTASEQIKQLAVQLEERLSYRVNIDTKLEKSRVEYTELTEQLTKIQARFYEIGADIARREQTLQHHKERKQQLQLDLAKSQQHELEAIAELEQDNTELAKVTAEFAVVLPNYTAALQQVEQVKNDYQLAKSAMQDCLAKWNSLQEQGHKLQQHTEIEKTRIAQLEKQTREYQIRLDRLLQEQASVSQAINTNNLEDLAEELANLELADHNLRQTLTEINTAALRLREVMKQEQGKIDNVREEIQVLKGRKASLETLQQAVLGKENQVAANWCQQHGLTNLPRVAEQIQVVTGWEKAVEVVLGKYLEYICVDNFAALLQNIPAAMELDLGLLNSELNTKIEQQPTVTNKVLLASKIHGSHAKLVMGLLPKVYVVEDLNAAILLQANLTIEESVITKAGIWLGLNWLRLPASDNNHAGVLKREQEIKTINIQLAELFANLTQLEAQLTTQENELITLQQQQMVKQEEVKEHEQALRHTSNEVSVAKTRNNNLTSRLQHLQAEINEGKQQIATITEEIAESRIALEDSIEKMASVTQEQNIFLKNKEELQQALILAEQQLHHSQEEMHQLAITKHTMEAKQQALEDSVKRLQKQVTAVQKHTIAINEALSTDSSPIEEITQELELLLEQRLQVEDELRAVKITIETVEQTMTALEKDRSCQEKLGQEIRSQLDELKMSWQAVKVKCQTIEEQLAAMQVVITEAIKQLPMAANEIEWSNNLEKINKKIERLGPINLAAVDEYQTELERQKYLHSQQADLEEALQILEQAINKIDRETRAKFRETFALVNENFQKLFPKLFGGGQASLELTENDLLEAGITVMARPPGKKNSTIHLLSGGEKALTAVALVFAIFQLNPAPFCMLDEVDAPLDEANVGRYGDMLKEMSSTVQFIFITHNKLTMEIAKQLAGVTMREPGVSRLVSVDIDEAIGMAVG